MFVMKKLLPPFIYIFLKIIFSKISQIIMQIKFYKKTKTFITADCYINKINAIKIGKNFGVSPRVTLLCQDPERGSILEIGDDVKLNFDVHINSDCGGVIKIGNNVIVGPRVVMRSSNHRFEDLKTPIMNQGHKPGEIIIEDNVWLGANVIVLPNVKIGSGAIVGAGSVVTKDIPANTIAIGVPAVVKTIRV